MKHKIVESRKSGRDSWKIKCSCGWFIIAYRYICEDAHADHAAPEPQPEPERASDVWYLSAYEPETTQEEHLALAPCRDRFL